jgi:hypothetical protein
MVMMYGRIQCAFYYPEVKKTILLVHSIRHRIFTFRIHGEDSGINLDEIFLKEILCLEKPQKANARPSASQLLKLGNRAGRLIDQEAVVVGTVEKCTVPDMSALDQFFNNEQNN